MGKALGLNPRLGKQNQTNKKRLFEEIRGSIRSCTIVSRGGEITEIKTIKARHSSTHQLRQEDLKFEATLSYISRPLLWTWEATGWQKNLLRWRIGENIH
jgi:hypothetical protein